ncbi:hypothetical protein GOP47_0009833 [Adiantum capillus-veneris]|uniref:Uncharacterized protein n=1 Tax=Adiantum capillus-veneris TaxID=13818 RepID=A0A9D4ZJ29_ADICA|nr:hypothetical protein GOP47_0009833 [Adiantum capillus-veneris]
MAGIQEMTSQKDEQLKELQDQLEQTRAELVAQQEANQSKEAEATNRILNAPTSATAHTFSQPHEEPQHIDMTDLPTTLTMASVQEVEDIEDSVDARAELKRWIFEMANGSEKDYM